MELHVVSIDPNNDFAESLKEALQSCNCSVEYFKNPEKALVYMKENRPDMLIMGIRMPYMDGKDFCAVIRSTPELEKLPIVLVSGEASIGDFSLYFKGVDFMTKPIDANELITKIKMYHKLTMAEETLSSILERRKPSKVKKYLA